MAEKIRKHKKLLAYMMALAVFTTYVVMDTFVITRVYGEAADGGSGTEAALQADNDNTEGQTEESTADGSEGSAADDAESGHTHGKGGMHGDSSGGPPSGGPGHGGKHSKSKSSSSGSTSSSTGTSSASTVDSYSDDNISIKLNEYTVSGTVVHVAEVKADPEYLKTAFAQGSYGRT